MSDDRRASAVSPHEDGMPPHLGSPDAQTPRQLAAGEPSGRERSILPAHAMTQAESIAAARAGLETAVSRDRARARTLAAQMRSSNRAGRAPATRSAEEVAPIPEKLRWFGVWLERTLGAIPLIAPLIMSGYFTTTVFMDAPIGVNQNMAIMATLALEGGLMRIVHIYQRTLLAGNSTISLRLGIMAYLGVISGLIYWHAWMKAGGGDMGWSWLPAAGTAGMSALGVYISSQSSRFAHRASLRERGLIDSQAPKFSILSWLFHPFRTLGALRHAIEYRIPSPTVAAMDYRLWVVAGRPQFWVFEEDLLTEPEPNQHREGAPRRRTEAERAGAAGAVIDGDVVPARREITPTAHRRRRDPSASASGMDVDDEILRNAEKILVVTAAYPDWRTTLPTTDLIIDAISADLHRRDGGSYNSRKGAGRVQKCLRMLLLLDDPQAVLNSISPLAENQL